MKPCSKYRKRIAWLASDALDAQEAAVLRDHLALCEGCRRYWEEMSAVTEGLSSIAPDSNLQASELFHHRVAEKLQAVGSGSVLAALAAWLRGSMPKWRLALPAIAALVIALLAMVALRHHPAVSPLRPPTVQVVSPANFGCDLAPTLANYRMIANESLEKFDELLTRQGNTPLPPAPVYTASGVQLANASF